MAYRRATNYSYPPKFTKLDDVGGWAKRLYAELLENDSRSEETAPRSTDKDLKELIVRPEWYGAKGDGSHDDTAAIQAAITACPNYGVVLLSAKTYLVGGSGAQVLLVNHPVNIRGLSKTGSVLMITASTGATTDIIRIDYSGIWSGAMFSDFCINKVSGTPGRHGIYIDLDATGQQFSYCTMSDLFMYQLGGYCIYVNATAADRYFDNYIFRSTLIGGIYIVGNGDSNTVEACLIGGKGYGIYADSVYGAGSLTFRSNTFISVESAIYAESAATISIVDNFFEPQGGTVGNSGVAGENAIIALKGTGDTYNFADISGNRINITPSVVDYGIYIDNFAYTLVCGNTISLGTGEQHIAYIDTNSLYCKFTNNYYPAAGPPRNYIDNYGQDTVIDEGAASTTVFTNVINESIVDIRGKWSNILGNWSDRGGAIATAVTGGATISDEGQLVNSSPSIGYAYSGSATVGTTDGGTVEITFSGLTMGTYNYPYYLPYVIMLSSTYWDLVSNLKIEYLNTDGSTWESIFDASPALLTSLVWTGENSYYSGYPPKGARFTFTFNAVDTIYIAETGIYNKGHLQGSSYFAALNASNTFSQHMNIAATKEYQIGGSAVVNQNVTSTAGPTFDHLHVSGVAAMTTAAESWVGPSSTAGVYFKGGNVGVGTSTPASILDIDGGTGVGLTKALWLRAGAADSESGPLIAFNPKYGAAHTYDTWNAADIGGVFPTAGTGGYRGALVFRTNSGANATNITEKMRLTELGNLGINDTAPAEKLDVNGNINTTGVVKVDDVQVVSNRVVDTDFGNTPNSGDSDTDDLIDKIRDALITHGLIASS